MSIKIELIAVDLMEPGFQKFLKENNIEATETEYTENGYPVVKYEGEKPNMELMLVEYYDLDQDEIENMFSERD